MLQADNPTPDPQPEPDPEPELSTDDVNCSDFATQEEAQEFFDENDPANDPYQLD